MIRASWTHKALLAHKPVHPFRRSEEGDTELVFKSIQQQQQQKQQKQLQQQQQKPSMTHSEQGVQSSFVVTNESCFAACHRTAEHKRVQYSIQVQAYFKIARTLSMPITTGMRSQTTCIDPYVTNDPHHAPKSLMPQGFEIREPTQFLNDRSPCESEDNYSENKIDGGPLRAHKIVTFRTTLKRLKFKST